MASAWDLPREDVNFESRRRVEMVNSFPLILKET